MGLLDKLESFLGGKKKDFNILVIGLDNSGKSTVVNNLKPNDDRAININPTVGFNSEKVNFRNLNLSLFDMSGQSRYRNLWEHYYREADAIVFVIDSSDRMRFVVSNEELNDVLNHREIKDKKIPLLILANKKDAKGALNESGLRNELEINGIRGKQYEIFATDGLSGQGVNDAFEWLANELKKE
ncbi:ADP-ribosylation factor 6 [Brachionus plicatilis]|uniref:ADP-ribosylation factor-like protein 6 n=1 Tax=Brachionus plicatilis TaxID=10195 RepID=A0A3M7PAD0_BRAPC|nr:ADP-ribosylation factor 6 [Brachionus plicatilis]